MPLALASCLASCLLALPLSGVISFMLLLSCPPPTTMSFELPAVFPAWAGDAAAGAGGGWAIPGGCSCVSERRWGAVWAP